MFKNYFITCLLFICLFFVSCTYEDGPVMSLRTPKARVVNKWKYHQVSMNGLNITTLYTNGYAEFKKNGDVTFFIRPDSINYGSWSLSDDKKTIEIDMIDQAGATTWSEDFSILKLKGQEMSLSGDVNGTTMKIDYLQY